MEDLDKKIIELMDLFDEGEVTTADKIDRPQRALDREAIDDFMKRNPQADGGRIGFKRGTDSDTSPVYNEKTGHIFKKGNRFGTYYSKTPGTNQHGALTRSLEEVQAIIDNAPKIKKKGKLVEMTAKDLEGRSDYNNVSKKIGPQKVYVTRKELDKYRKDLKFKTTGKPVLEEQSKYSKIRKAKDLARSNPAILNKLGGKKGLQLSHLSLGELDTLKNLGYLPADINIKQYHPFEKKIVAISKDIYDIQNNKNLSVSEKRMAIAQKQKEDRALRKKFPKFANTKARLTVKATGLDESGLMIKEKLPDPSIAIAPDEAGTTLKQIDSKSTKADEIAQIAKLNLDKQIENVGQRLAAIGCPGKAKGGRVEFNLGGSSECITRGLENLRTGNMSPGAKANARQLVKNPSALTRFAKFALGPLGIPSEIALGGIFAATGYATGANKDEIVNDLSFGLFGKSMDEQAQERNPLFNAAKNLDKTYSQFLAGLDKQGNPLQGKDMRGMRKVTTAEDVYKAMEPFQRVNPQLESGQMFDLDMFDTALATPQELQKEKTQRALDRGFYTPGDRSIDPFQAAGGGIAKEAGDPSGPPPESGPNSQGLQGLLNRVKKT